MQANELTRDRLRRLADVRPPTGKVLSLYLNLDPTEFATPAARSSEIRSLLSRAERIVRDEQRLSHEERAALRDDLERVRDFLGGQLDADGAHGIAIFCSQPAGLFEVLKLPRPVDHDAIVNDTPYVEPLVAIGTRDEWCVLLANRHVARIMRGSRHALREVERIQAELGGRDQGGGFPASETRTTDHDVERHFKRVSQTLLQRFARRPPNGLFVGAPRGLVGDLESRLHSDVRRYLAGRIDVDVEHSTPAQVTAAVEPVIDFIIRKREDELFDRLRERVGTGERAAAGLEAVLDALNEQRVEALLLEEGFQGMGKRCPTCGWLGITGTSDCPADGTALLAVDDVVEAAVERAIGQSAEVLLVSERPELAPHGRIAALLRF
jgi:peptide subunit release factor 1 (eRF1)